MSMATKDEAKQISHTGDLEHAAECWGKNGPGYEVRAAVAELKAWTKGIGIALLLLQLLSAGSTVAKWIAPAMPAAQAQGQR